MVPSEPDPEHEPAPGSEAAPEPRRPDREPRPEADPESGPDPEQARRTSGRLLWSCAWLTVLVGFFQLSGILRTAEGFGVLAWLGVGLVALCLLALIALYIGCALDRLNLRTRVLMRLDLFQASTAVMLLAIVAGVLVPTPNTTGLALLLPWGLTYWLHNLEAT